MVLVRHEAGAFAQTGRRLRRKMVRAVDRIEAKLRIWRRSTTWCTTRSRAPPSTSPPRSARCAGATACSGGSAGCWCRAADDLPRLALALLGVGLVFLLVPRRPTPGPRGPTSTSASRCSPTCPICRRRLPTCSAPFPFDFLYGNIAADSSIAKHYAPAGPPLSLLARRPGDPRSRRHRRPARLRAGLSEPPRRRHRRPQLLRAPPADAHQQHRRRGALLLGNPGRGPPGRRLRQGGQGRDPAGPRPPMRTSTASSRRRSSVCAPTADCSAAWCT